MRFSIPIVSRKFLILSLISYPWFLYTFFRITLKTTHLWYLNPGLYLPLSLFYYKQHIEYCAAFLGFVCFSIPIVAKKILYPIFSILSLVLIYPSQTRIIRTKDKITKTLYIVYISMERGMSSQK